MNEKQNKTELNKEKERCKERPYSNNDFTTTWDTRKSRLMAINGKQIQVNH